MKSIRRFAPILVTVSFFSVPPATLLRIAAAQAEQKTAVDSDQDGLSDALEQELLVQFAPTFMIGRQDCAGIPAEFAPNVESPTVEALSLIHIS